MMSTSTFHCAETLQVSAGALNTCSSSLVNWHTIEPLQAPAQTVLTDFTLAAQLFVVQLGSPEGRIVSSAYLVKSLLRYLRTQDDAELQDAWESGSLAHKVAK